MRAEFSHDWEGYLTFRIPIDEKAFAFRHSSTYMLWVQELIISNNRDSHFTEIKNVMPDLDVAEKYLKTTYPGVYRNWKEIQDYVSNHNKKHREFLGHLGSLFEQFFDPKSQGFVERRMAKNTDQYVYVLDDIIKTLFENLSWHWKEPIESLFTRLSLQQSSQNPHWLLSSAMWNVLISSDKDKIDAEKVGSILRRIVGDRNVRIQFVETRKIDPPVIDKLDKFCELLEKNVVNDISNQV